MKTLVALGAILLATPAWAQLNADEAESLRFMREEEKLARDTYLQLYDLYVDAQFANVAKSEQRHMDSVLDLLIQYGMEDSATSEIGVFNNPDLQELHDVLMAKGRQSRAMAFQVGILIEEKDIADLQVSIAATENVTLDQVFGRLLNGSYNHLAAFSRGLAALAGFPESTYTEGWYSTWMGWIALANYPWVQTANGEWFAIVPVDQSGIYVLDTSGNWHWTSQNYYPWVYDISNSVWRSDGLPTT
jgi:hypothetical protein